VAWVVERFWCSSFGSDNADNFFSPRSQEFNSLAEWERLSKENPLFVLQTDWCKSGCTVGQFLKWVDSTFGYENQEIYRKVWSEAGRDLHNLVKTGLKKAEEKVDVDPGADTIKVLRHHLAETYTELYQMAYKDAKAAITRETRRLQEQKRKYADAEQRYKRATANVKATKAAKKTKSKKS
jgi:hypothetical protein